LTAGAVPAFGAAGPEFAQLRRLTEISRALTYTTSLEQVTRLTVERGAELLGAGGAVLMLADAGGLLHVRAAHGIDEERVARFGAPLTDELIGRLQGLLAVPDDCFVAVPLVVGGAVTGLLAVAMRQPCGAADESLLSALADQAAVAIESARLGGEVREEMERLRAGEGATTAKDRALATLAHDIRTPIGAIDGYSAILEDEIHGVVNDRQREVLGRIRMSGRHLLSLLDNVMDMARLTAGVVRVDAQPVRLADVAREAVHMLVPAADAKLQLLQLGGPAGDVAVTADHARVRQVLVNLIGNAVKFTPRDGSVTVTTSVAAEPGSAWGEIRVADSGPGIAEAERAAIFEPYYRSEGTADLPGVGLGLAISHALVREMGGELELESEPGAGSTFIVRLPLLRAPPAGVDG
jgi:sigma-B regulation protein RsbU (phosphoserine phosphatase)